MLSRSAPTAAKIGISLTPQLIRPIRRFAQVSDAQLILESGFQKMKSKGYRKSEQELSVLVEAAARLGVESHEVKELYLETKLGNSREQLSSEQRLEDARREIEALEPPSLDEAYEYNELPPLGHLQLHEHRIQRGYVRAAAYDLPQLSKYATPYQPPSKKQVLKFKYVTYLGEEHPAERKVVLSAQSSELGLLPEELHKLRLLSGSRYNDKTDELRIGCSRFQNQAQNKRYLAEVFRDLLAESKDSPGNFSDVPLDTRHSVAKLKKNPPIYPAPKFPDEWKRPQDAPRPASGPIIFNAFC